MLSIAPLKNVTWSDYTIKDVFKLTVNPIIKKKTQKNEKTNSVVTKTVITKSLKYLLKNMPK